MYIYKLESETRQITNNENKKHRYQNSKIRR